MKTSELKYHLLSGSSFGNVTSMLYHSGLRISAEHLPKLLYVLTTTLLLVPFQFVENWFYNSRIKKTRILDDPIFIIGHWRSGTTYLHNLLTRDDQFIFPDTYQCFLPGAFLTGKGFLRFMHKKTLPSVRPMDNVAMDPGYPQEEEFAMCSLCRHSYYQSIFFPGRMSHLFEAFALMKTPSVKKWEEQYLLFLKKVTYAKHGKQLVLKNPVNTARINCLLKLFPNAKFIYLYRNEKDTLQSTFNLYSQLLKINCFENITTADLKKNIFSIYKETLSAYRMQKVNIPGKNLIEIPYEEFIQNPLETIEKIYRGLGISGFWKARAPFIQYISKQVTYVCNAYSK